MMDMLAADLDKEITKWRLRRRMPRLKKGLLKVHQKGFLVYRFFVWRHCIVFVCDSWSFSKVCPVIIILSFSYFCVQTVRHKCSKKAEDFHCKFIRSVVSRKRKKNNTSFLLLVCIFAIGGPTPGAVVSQKKDGTMVSAPIDLSHQEDILRQGARKDQPEEG